MLFHPDRSDVEDATVGSGERAGDFKVLTMVGELNGHCLADKHLVTKILHEPKRERRIISGEFEKSGLVASRQRNQQVMGDFGERDEAFSG